MAFERNLKKERGNDAEAVSLLLASEFSAPVSGDNVYVQASEAGKLPATAPILILPGKLRLFHFRVFRVRAAEVYRFEFGGISAAARFEDHDSEPGDRRCRWNGYRIVMTLDQASWRMYRKFKTSGAIRLVPLPPNSPELNPAGRLLEYVREQYPGNCYWNPMNELEDRLVDIFQYLLSQTDPLRSLAFFNSMILWVMTENWYQKAQGETRLFSLTLF